MKLKLSINDSPWQNYVNVDPCPEIDEDKKHLFRVEQRGFDDIDDIVADAECIEIIADGVIDHITCGRISHFLDTVCKKLRHQGQLIIVGIDPLVLATLYANGLLTTAEFHSRMFGQNEHPWASMNGHWTLDEVETYLLNKGLHIESTELNEAFYTIKARRK